MKIITKIRKLIISHEYVVKCYDTQADDLKEVTISSYYKPLSVTALKKELAAIHPDCKFLSIKSHNEIKKVYSMAIDDFMNAAVIEDVPDSDKEEN